MMRTAIAATSRGPNRLDVFGTGLDDKVYHKRGIPWENWEQVGFPSLNLSSISSPAVTKQLDVVARDPKNEIFYSPYPWNSKVDLKVSFSSAPAVATWDSGRRDVVGLDSKNQVVHRFSTGGSWKDGGLPSFTSSSQPAIVAWGGNHLDVFALDGNSQMYHNAWDDNQKKWTAWQSLQPLDTQQFVSPPVACAGVGNHSIDVFGVGADGKMVHRYLKGTTWLPANKWESLGGLFLSLPVVALWPDLGLHVFAVGYDNHLWQKFFWKDAETWSPSGVVWQPLGGFLDSPPAVVAWKDANNKDRVDVFALGMDNRMYHKFWDGTKWIPEALDLPWELLAGQSFQPAPGP